MRHAWVGGLDYSPRLRRSPLSSTSEAPSGRLLSLDVVRGITVGAMLVVNNPGSWTNTYSQLRHSQWDGCTFTDVIFPAFLFIAGAAMTYATESNLRRGLARMAMLRRMTIRAVMLFALGLLLHAFPWWHTQLSTLRIPGVLQRIALASMLGAPFVLWLRVRGQAVVAALLLVSYWILLTHVAAPGETPGSLLPGRDIGAYLDRTLLGVNHLAREGHGGDPAGLLGTIPAAASLLLGAIAGAWTSSTRPPRAKWIGLLGAGVAALALGLVWGRSFPINKSLWTSSYVVFTAGWSALLLGACYWLVEVRRTRRWIGSFVRFGRQALLVYFLSEVTTSTLDAIGARSSAYHLLQRISASATMASLAYALLYVSCWAVLLAWVERTRVRVRA